MVKKTLTQEESELEILRKQVSFLSEKLQSLLSEQSLEKKEEIDEEHDDTAEIIISGDDYIKVISLCPMFMTLTTQKKGKGKIFNFEEFGKVKRILYRDLVDIMENHTNFLEEGLFYILNKNVIRKHGLDEVYSKILSKEKIEQILKGNLSDAVNLFKTAISKQQELMCMMIIDDIVAGKEMDLNFVDRISRIVGYNLLERAEETKALIEIRTQRE